MAMEREVEYPAFNQGDGKICRKDSCRNHPTPEG